MLTELKRGLVFTVVMMALMGGAYPGLVWVIGRAAFPGQAEGSLIRRADGTVAGSRLVAQSFTRDEYLSPRPSAVDYNAASTGGSSYGPTNPDHLKAVAARLADIERREGVPAAQVPSEVVTASGSGMDPHISPASAGIQAARVARARNVDIGRIRALIEAHTEGPQLGFLGMPRVNVLELNIALDDALGAVK